MSEGGFLLSRVVGCARVLGTWLMTCSLPRRAVGPGVGKMGAGAIPEDGRWAQENSCAHENWARVTVSATCPVISGLRRTTVGLGNRKKRGAREVSGRRKVDD